MSAASPYYFVRPRQNVGRNRDANLMRCPKIQNQVDLTNGLDWQILRASTRQNPLDVLCRKATDFMVAHAVARKSPLGYKALLLEHRRQFFGFRHIDD